MELAKAISAIRNASSRRLGVARVRNTKLVRSVCDCLVREGYLWSAVPVESMLDIQLKYGISGDPVIREIRNVSVPSRKKFCGRTELRPVLAGIGCAIISTNQGVMSDAEARRRSIGGEVLVEIS